MCGILGIKFKNKNEETISLMKKIMGELKIRGLHSFGVSYLTESKIITLKSFKFDLDFLLKDFVKNDSKELIWHNRYSTSGDWENMENNQPIQQNNASIVVNGVLSMKTKEEMEEEFNVKMQFDNDAEIFLKKANDGELLQFLTENKSSSFAGIYLSPNEFYALRNNKRPLYSYEDENIKLYCSTLDTLKRSGLDISKCKIVSPYTRGEL